MHHRHLKININCIISHGLSMTTFNSAGCGNINSYTGMDNVKLQSHRRSGFITAVLYRGGFLAFA